MALTPNKQQQNMKPAPPTTAYGVSQTPAPGAIPAGAQTLKPTQPGPAAPTNYVQKGGKDLNEILYLKGLYEGAGPNGGGSPGAQSWASGQAGQYYNNLSPVVAGAVKGMNYNQLRDYINGLGGTEAAPAATSESATTGFINDMYKSNLANLNQQAYDARNQSDAVNFQNARSLQEMMAQQGLGASGENLTATLQQNAQRQGGLNDINNQLAQNINNLDVNRANQLLEQYNTDQNRALQLAGLLGNYNGQRTLAGQQFDRGIFESDRGYNRDVLTGDRAFDWGKAMDLAGLTGLYEGNPTFDREKFNRSNMESDRSYNRGVLESDRSYNLAAAKGAGGGADSYGGTKKDMFDPGQPTTYSEMAAYINSRLPGGKVTAGPPSPNEKELIERMIVNNPNLSEADMYRLYRQFEIPLTK